MSGLAFTKGHGTENDFVLVADPDGRLDLRPEQVRALADRREGLQAPGAFAIATRAGVKAVRTTDTGYAVDLGPARVDESEGAAESGFNAVVHPHGGPELPGLRVDVGNPHTVVVLPPHVALDGLDLTVAPHVAPHPPEGTNVEFVQVVGPGHIAMRVHERGVGETRSCGTGAVAAATATRWWDGTWTEGPGSGSVSL